MVVAADAIILPASTRPYDGCRGYPVELEYHSQDENVFWSKSLPRKAYRRCMMEKNYGKSKSTVMAVLPRPHRYLLSFGDGDSRNRNVASSGK